MAESRRSTAALVVLAVLLSAAPALLWPSNSKADAYAGHVRFHHTSCCGMQTAVFKAFGRSNVRYRVCLIRPSGDKKCRNLRTGAPRKPSRTTFINQGVGTHRVIWKVNGRVVDRDNYYVAVEGV
jgi:hypothetical protein